MRSGIQGLRELLANRPMELIVPLVVFAITLAVGYLVRSVLLRALRAWNSRTETRPGRILTEALRGPMAIWILILAVHLAIQSSTLPPRLTRWSPRVLGALLILSLTLLCVRLGGAPRT